jgi:heat shock protein HslJ
VRHALLRRGENGQRTIPTARRAVNPSGARTILHEERTMRRMRRATLLSAALLAAAACATTVAVPSRALGGGDWRLVEIGGRPALVDVGTPAGAPYLRFVTDSGRVVGSTGCNRLSGPFTRDGDTLRFGTLVTTKVACAEETRQAQERDFLLALERTRRHAIAGDTLALHGDDAAAAPLARLTTSRTP